MLARVDEMERLRAENAALRRLTAELAGSEAAIALAAKIQLSPREAEMVAIVWRRSPRPIPYRTILEAAYWDDPSGGPCGLDGAHGTIKSRLTKARNKLAAAGAPAGLKTIHGQGVLCTSELSAWLSVAMGAH